MEGKLEQGILIKELLKDADLKGKAKEIANFVGKIIEEINRMPQERKERLTRVKCIDEVQVLEEAKEFLKAEINAEIAIYKEESPSLYDPKNRAKMAKPWRPAIYIE
jgi:leucyl-tRNA synthetase